MQSRLHSQTDRPPSRRRRRDAWRIGVWSPPPDLRSPQSGDTPFATFPLHGCDRCYGVTYPKYGKPRAVCSCLQLSAAVCSCLQSLSAEPLCDGRVRYLAIRNDSDPSAIANIKGGPQPAYSQHNTNESFRSHFTPWFPSRRPTKQKVGGVRVSHPCRRAPSAARALSAARAPSAAHAPSAARAPLAARTPPAALPMCGHSASARRPKSKERRYRKSLSETFKLYSSGLRCLTSL